jgi:hypothetical protein
MKARLALWGWPGKCCARFKPPASGGETNGKSMKKLALLTLGCLLTFQLTALAEPAPADQKWLEAVKTMVINGETKISTPSQERVDLLKEWAAKNGYSVQVAKTERGFRLDVSRRLAKN